MIRWQTLSKGGTLQIEKLLVTEWRGMLSGAVSAPFPIWQLRNGDRIHGQAISWDGKKVKVQTSEGLTLPLPVPILDVVWLSDPAADLRPEVPMDEP
jgi:hypothetical protein